MTCGTLTLVGSHLGLHSRQVRYCCMQSASRLNSRLSSRRVLGLHFLSLKSWLQMAIERDEPLTQS